MDSYLVKILQAASDNPEYQAIANYLMARRAMPEMQMGGTNSYGSFATPGLFSSGQIPDRGRIRLNQGYVNVPPAEGASTLTHEATHAAERQMIKQYYELKDKPNKTDLEKQFLGNFQKIIGSSEPQINKWLKTVVPSFATDKADYRAKSNEALAFGVENSSFNNNISNAPAHIDPTIATQFQLLLDQAQRVQDQQTPKGR